MQYHENILKTIGNTPLIKLNRIIEDIPALVLLKNETFNPGHSIKDRMALKMLEDAEARGDIQPGGTIIECTSACLRVACGSGAIDVLSLQRPGGRRLPVAQFQPAALITTGSLFATDADT